MTEALCPTCGRPALPQGDPTFPFCCARCKMADLGRWLGGGYRIPYRSADEEEDESPGGLDA